MYSSRRTKQNHMPSFSSISVLPCNDALRCRVSDTFQEVERGRLLDGHVRLGHATQTMDTNPIKTAIMVCSELIRRKVRRILEKESESGTEIACLSCRLTTKTLSYHYSN